MKNSEILIYQNQDGNIKVDVRLEEETVWLTQVQLCELFNKSKATISEHIKNVFKEGELDPLATVRNFRTVQQEGARAVERKIDYYNLDVIISVGYRVKSPQGTQFRIWATQRLKEYIIKGFTMDDERLKNPNNIFGKDYFEEQLARIHDIRSSERRFYQKIADIYSSCSADYSKDTETTKTFYATVQNKLHWAITGQTAAELISARVDSTKENMGLTTWKNAPQGKISHEKALEKSSAEFEKYKLNQKELEKLNSLKELENDIKKIKIE